VRWWPVVATLCWFVTCPRVWGDGGVPVASVVRDGTRSTLLVAPAQPRQGQTVISLLGGPSGSVWLGLRWLDESRTAWEVMEAETVGPGRHTAIVLDRTGPLRLMVRSDPAGPDLLSADIGVEAAEPLWQSRLPWIFSWLPVAAILVLGELARRGRA
jgi:hypothetical protein